MLFRSIYIRVTSKDTANTPIRYAWTEVYRLENGSWQNTTHTANTTDDYAMEINNTSLSVTDGKIYRAERSTDTGEWMFAAAVEGGGNGTTEIKGTETVLMILGDWTTYKDCPDAPPAPPMTYANYPCDDTRTTTVCVPAYAFAVYQRCGYVWNKVGDSRDFGVWATELNGGTFSAWRRFVIPRWGGDIDPVTGLPDPLDSCMGVAFYGAATASALICSCPACIAAIGTTKCLEVHFRTTAKPLVWNECGSTVTHFDNEDLWEKDIVIELSGGCTAGGLDSTGTFDFGWQFQTGSSLECDWGPAVFDPCDPCAHFGVLSAYIGINEDTNVNCGGSGHWRGEFNAKEICELLCTCTGDPVQARVVSMCDGCGNNVPPIFYFIESDSVELVCC